jgi:hypothetical protein
VQQKIKALSNAIWALEAEHGSAPRDASFPHDAEPRKCACECGASIRAVRTVRRDLYARISESRKARAFAAVPKAAASTD